MADAPSTSRDDGDWEAWGGYMAAKKQKLSVQFTKDRSKEQTGSKIFDGVAIFVNGYTEPSASELRRLMITYGGAYHMYEMANTTHVIASALPKSKIDKLKPGERVVTAAWITDSISAGRLLPDVDYLLYGKRQGCTTMNKFVRVDQVENKPLPAPAPPPPAPLAPPAPLPPAPPAPSVHASTAADDQSKFNMLPKTSDPQFLKDYYARSRLHFISTWGQKMKRLVDELRAANDGTFPGRQLLTERINVGIGRKAHEPVFVHIDMDCFFVSVGLATRPHLRGKPVAVTHAKGVGKDTQPGQRDKLSSFAEIASCSYEARAAGLKNGMLLGKALRDCPNLTAIPFDFEAYQAVSDKLYRILASYTLNIRAVSCDEMYMDLTELCGDLGIDDPLLVIAVIRQQIADETGCPASAGLGPNMLVARLATRRAKPNGQCYVPQKDVQSFMADQRVADLPGVGHNVREKMEMNFGAMKTCADLQSISSDRLKTTFGPKFGQQLHDLCRGIDKSTIKETVERKSVSCDINYGIRFESDTEAVEFLKNLAVEVTRKLDEIGMAGRMMTLKIMTRQADAPINPSKFMGHGWCDTASRSTTLSRPIRDDRQIATAAISLFRQLNPVVVDLRGVAIMMTKLESTSKQSDNSRQSISRFCVKPTEAARIVQQVEQTVAHHEQARAGVVESNVFDPEVMAALPEDIRREIASHPSQFQPKTVKSEDVVRVGSGNEHDMTLLLPDGSKCDKNVLAALPEDIRKEIASHPSQFQPKVIKSEDVVRVGSRNEHDVSLLLPDGSKCDKNVLAELPASLRKEVMLHARPRTSAAHTRTELFKAPPTESLPRRPLAEAPQLRGERDYDKVKKILLTMLTADEPVEQDVVDLAEYLGKMVIFGNLKSVGCYLRIIDRELSIKKSAAWDTAQQLILDSIHTEVIEHYGCRFEWRS